MRGAPWFWRWLKRFIAAVAAVPVLVGAAWLVFLGRPPALPPPVAPDGVERAGWPSPISVGPTGHGACIRVLAIDGGGVRGLVPALLLERIEERTNAPIAALFDLIVGTSTGSILALGLTRPSDADASQPMYKAQEIVQLFKENAATIFPSDFALLRWMQGFFRPKYRPHTIEAVYERYFGDVRFSEALTRIAVPAYDIKNRRRIWFGETGHTGLFMKDIVRGATAVPTYFPPVRLAVQKREVPEGYITLVDGAVFANNPVQDAFAFAQKLRPRDLKPDDDGSVLLVSVGTGAGGKTYEFESAWGWGAISWLNPLLEILLSDPGLEVQARRVAALAGVGYLRLQPDFGESLVPLDASTPEAIEHLTAVTRKYLDGEKKDDLDILVTELKQPRSRKCRIIGQPYERPSGPRRRSGAL
jgi:uncharacterized protein